MPSAMVHDFEVGWSSSDPALLDTSVSTSRQQGAGSLQLTARAGAAGVTAGFTLPGPMDLSAFDELRLWTFASRAADGAPRSPFLLELSFQDAADTPGDVHRWLVPVNRRRTWEQHCFGITGDRRGQVTDLSLRCLTDEPFQIRLDELLAVQEEPLADLEAALTRLLDGLPLPGVTGLPVPPASAGDDALPVDLNTRLHPGNRIRIDGTTAEHAVIDAVHDEVAGTTTLTLQPVLAAAVGPGATLSVVAPVLVEESPFHAPAEADDLPDPVLLISLTDQREEPERGWNVPQRDSFRVRGGLTVCSLRPPPRPVLVEHQILPAATERSSSLALRAEILRRIGVDTGVRVNGRVLPVQTVLPPPLDIRVRAVAAPVYLRTGTRIEQGERTEVPWVHRGRLLSGPWDSPWDPSGPEPPPSPDAQDQEGIVLRI
jgi:hypothetical protein